MFYAHFTLTPQLVIKILFFNFTSPTEFKSYFFKINQKAFLWFFVRFSHNKPKYTRY